MSNCVLKKLIWNMQWARKFYVIYFNLRQSAVGRGLASGNFLYYLFNTFALDFIKYQLIKYIYTN